MPNRDTLGSREPNRKKEERRKKKEERRKPYAGDYNERWRASLLQGLGAGQPVVFSHAWPLSADAWEALMLFLAGRGFRCVAHDRRGHGRSSQPWNGNEMNTYADDLAALTEAVDLKDAIHVGHSTGCGEVARYFGRHGTKRVTKRSEEHTSELQSLRHLVCRLLLEK